MHDRDDGEDDLRVARDEAAPAGDERAVAAGLRVVDLRQERDLEPVDAVAEQRERGGQQRVGDQHGRQDAERAADAELRDEVEADERQAGDGDRHGQAGEQDRAAGRRAGLGRGVARRQAVVQELSEPCDDEQRVVDPDAEADHRDEDRRDRVDVGQAGEDEQQQERGDERA